MKMNLSLRFSLIALAIAAAIFAIYANGLKPGIDLAGGTQLIYELDVHNFPNGAAPADLANKVIETMKNRVDPQGVKNLKWSVLGQRRIQIEMPFADKTAKEAKTQFDTAVRDLAASNVRVSEVENALKLPAAQRRPALDALAKGDPERKKLIGDLAAAADKLNDANEKAAKYPNAEDVPVPVIEARSTAQHAYDAARLALSQTNIDVSEVLTLLDERAKPKNTTAQPALDRIAADHPSQKAALDNLLAARKTFDDKHAAGFSDAAELERQLAGAGVLEFRIAPTIDMGQVDPPELTPAVRQALAELPVKGPRHAGNASVAWFEIDPDQGDSLKTPRYIRQQYQGRDYILLYNDSAHTLTHQGAEKDQWKLTDAYVSNDPASGGLAVDFRLDAAGGRYMGELTGNNIKRQMAILLDDKAIEAPVIKGQIGDQGQISMNSDGRSFDQIQKDANNLRQVLQAGSLPATLEKDPVSVVTISSDLGEDNIRAGVRSAVYALIAVLAFMVIYYTITGFFADVALMINLLVTVAVMAWLQATWTLPGIAGMVLTLGMAVDANILINERIREELHKGSSLALAVKIGYEKVFWTIFDANLTTSLTSIVLIFVGSEEVKGFGVTLLIGLAVHMFTALYVTRTLMAAAIRAGVFKAIDDLSVAEYFRDLVTFTWLRGRWPFMRVITVTNFDWIGKRHLFWAVSAVFMVGGIVALYAKGDRAYDTEFNGGTKVTFRLRADKHLSVADVRERVAAITRLPGDQDLDVSDATIQEIGDQHNEFQVTTGLADTTDGAKKKTRFLQALGNQFADVIDRVPALTYDGAPKQDQPGVTAAADVKPLFDNGTIKKITKADLSQVAPGLNVKDADYVGGVAVTLKNISPPVPLETLADRIRRGSSRPVRVLAAAGSDVNPGAPVSQAVVLAVDPMPLELTDNNGFNTLAEREWQELGNTLGTPSDFTGVSSFDNQAAAAAKRQAVIAIAISLILIVIYVWVRFGGLRYGLGAIFSLVHDAIVAVAATVLAGPIVHAVPGLAKVLLLEDFRINLTMIAAYLTIIGYSVNDTIVIFDRIRENRGRSTGPLSPKLVNDSINQCFGRTVWTTFTVFIVVLILYIWGGPGVHGFAYAMLIGVFTGAYSTLAIASPTLLNVKELPSSLPPPANRFRKNLAGAEQPGLAAPQ